VAAVPPGAAGRIARSRLELADIVRAQGDAYRWRHRLTSVQHRALRAIAACRTAALGGHREGCDHCGATRVSYNSCRNRHCPKCQTTATERWLAARKADLLPIPYFHVVFTLPHALNALAQGNPRVIYRLLFGAGSATLLAFGRDPRYLGGTIGVTAILHTWGQNLSQHLHLHCLVTGGALAPDRARWIPTRGNFLFPVRALSRVFRGKFLAALQEAYAEGALAFVAGTAPLADRMTFATFVAQLRTTEWMVYAKRPFAGPEPVLEYLGRYTHRVAISNHRLVAFTNGAVQFRWKDYADGDRVKVLTLTAEEFLRRFLLHVVPARFMRIRHFGLLANRRRTTVLARCRQLLAVPAPTAAPASGDGAQAILSGLRRCPFCHVGSWVIIEIVPQRSARLPPDSS
jgi:Putative transposase/Transposase zinc-binding domain